MTKVLATGVFNILHPGHLLFLNEARKLGDELIVIVSSDNIAKKNKAGFVLSQDQRAAVVRALKSVDKVLIGDDKDILALLPSIKPDVIALGHDQQVDEQKLRLSLDKLGLKARIARIKKKDPGALSSSSSIARKLSD